MNLEDDATLGEPGDGDGEVEDLLRRDEIRGLLGRRPGPGAPSPSRTPGYLISADADAKLGEGTFAEVFRARDLRLPRDVAIKILKPGALSDQVQQARMENEAKALARLQGGEAVAQVVGIIERSRTTDGRPFLVLELVEGGSLADRIGRSGPLPAREAAAIVESVARAVGALHAREIIHRDLKPSNILLTPDCRPKLADFGLARSPESPPGLTLESEVIGTPQYMAPEQARGRHAQVGPASDIYSLGAILYECTTGRPPFLGPTASETLVDLLSDEEPVSPRRLVPSVPRDLATICLKSLRKRPADRYGSAAELADDLRRHLDGREILARPAGPIERSLKWVRRNPTIAALIGLFLISVAGVVGTVRYARRAVTHEARSVANAGLRLQVLTDVLKFISSDRLRKAGQRALQVQLLDDLLPRFEEVLQLEGDDPATRRLRGLALNSLTTIRYELGKSDLALNSIRQAEATFRALATGSARRDEDEISLATALGQRGTILGQAGKFAEAIAGLAEAVPLLERRIATGGTPLRERLGQVHNSWANCLRFGKVGPDPLASAERHYREAVRWYESAAADSPSALFWHAKTLSNLALLVGEDKRRVAEAVGLASRAADLAKALVNSSPGEIDRRDCLATCLTNVADLRRSSGDVAGALPLFRGALSIYEPLALQVSDNFEYRWNVAMGLSDIGQCLGEGPEAGRPEAEKSLARAAALYEFLVKQSPGNEDLNRYVAENRKRIEGLAARRGSRPWDKSRGPGFFPRASDRAASPPSGVSCRPRDGPGGGRDRAVAPADRAGPATGEHLGWLQRDLRWSSSPASWP